MSLNQKKKNTKNKKKDSYKLQKEMKVAFKEVNTEKNTSALKITNIPFFVWLNNKIRILVGKSKKTA